jgi:type VI secretion system secreted protein Hcp
MAVDYFLKLDGAGIKGESPVEGLTDYMQIESYSWGATQTGSFSHGGGGGGGKVSMQDFHFTMKTNKASPKLMAACASGEHIKTGTLIARKAGGKAAVQFLKVVMTDLLVSSYQTGGSGGGDEIPMDQISLNFAKVEFTYKDQKADGTAGSDVVGGWDLKKMTAGK